MKQYKIKVNNKTVEVVSTKKDATKRAWVYLDMGNQVFITNFRNEVIWKPSDTITKD